MIVFQQKLIDGKMRTIRKVIMPKEDIPTVPDTNVKTKGFVMAINPEKDVTKNTFKTYKGQLNKMTKALGYTTAADLIKHPEQILTWVRSTYSDISKQKLFMSSVFYILNQKPFIKMGVAKPYYDAFQTMKKAQVADNVAKGKIDNQVHSEALLNIGLSQFKIR